MNMTQLHCAGCGAQITPDWEKETTACAYCGNVYVLEKGNLYQNSGKTEKKDKVTICIEDAEFLGGEGSELLSADALGQTYHAEMAYENPDGSNIVFDTDFFGNKRPAGNVTPGPFEVMGVEMSERKFEI